jgi:lipopolysaccharide transport system ATP-binding protein
MKNSILKVNNVSKLYRIGSIEEKEDTFVGSIFSSLMHPLKNLQNLKNLTSFKNSSNDEDVLWALKNINFKMNEGTVLGIIGKNGAGKSTLLKILSKITEPSDGSVEYYGKMASLLEVGTGFHLELTGRENIYLNGSILGMNKAEIDIKFDEIVSFSGVRQFIDTPVKRYSSGMIVRLGFSVAAHLDPDILLVDEVLAVGDADFQKKCLQKLDDVSKSGRTVIFVSHNMGTISSLCNRVICIDGGQIVFDGKTEEGIKYYFTKVIDDITATSVFGSKSKREGDGNALITNVLFQGRDKDNKVIRPRLGRLMEIIVSYECKEDQIIDDFYFNLDIKDSFGNKSVSIGNLFSGNKLKNPHLKGNALCIIPKCQLFPGEYIYTISCFVNHQKSDKIYDAGVFTVESGNYYNTGKLPSYKNCSFLLDYAWEIKK